MEVGHKARQMKQQTQITRGFNNRYRRDKQSVAQISQSQVMSQMENKGREKRQITPISLQTSKYSTASRLSMMGNFESAIDRLPKACPTGIAISTLSTERILAESAGAIIEQGDLTESEDGVYSVIMGSVMGNSRCGTCRNIRCPGHFAHVKLEVPIILPQSERVVMAIFNCVCPYCSNVPMTRDKLREINPKALHMSETHYLSELEKASKGLKCGNTTIPAGEHVRQCTHMTLPVVDITSSRGQNCIVTTGGSSKAGARTYNSFEIKKIFDRISDEGAEILGFGKDSHPRDLITDVIVVPNPSVRPPCHANGETKHDGITNLYVKLIKTNNKIKEDRANAVKHEKTLLDIVKAIIVEDKKTKRGAKATFSILQRFKGKEGHFRRDMMGKRNDYTARLVISPASYLRFGEFAVPQAVASIWGVPEIVTPSNIDYIRKLLNAGRIISYKPRSGKDAGRLIKYKPGSSIVLKYGDMVNRWTETGDIVVPNRQPSLHRGSIMAATAVVVSDRESGGLHPATCSPYNADFDGDQMTLHKPIGRKALAEARDLMHVRRNLMDPTQNKPMMGLILDHLTNAYLMTSPKEGLDPYEFRFVYNKIENPPRLEELQERAGKYGLHPYSGRTLFSALFHDDFRYSSKDFEIVDGILVTGRASSRQLGRSHRSLIQDIYHRYGSDVASDFITNATWLTIAWGNTFGFSVGIADCEYGRSAGNLREAVIAKIEREIELLGPRPTDPVLAANYELRIRAIVDQVKPLGRSLAKQYMSEDKPLKGRQNAFACMGKEFGSGAKGDPFNIGQIYGSAGQQTFNDKRLEPTMNEGRRALPTQPKRPTNIEAPAAERGFVPSSYMQGMTPEEMYMILNGGLQGMIDTNLATADVGALQRLTAKAGENIVVDDKGAVSSADDVIYAFMFAGDNMEPRELLNVGTPYGSVPTFCDIGTIIDQVNAECGWVTSKVNTYIEQNKADAAEIDRILEERTTKFIPEREYETYEELTMTEGGGYMKLEPEDPRNKAPIIDLIQDSPVPIPEPSRVSYIPYKPFSLKKMSKTPLYSTPAIDESEYIKEEDPDTEPPMLTIEEGDYNEAEEEEYIRESEKFEEEEDEDFFNQLEDTGLAKGLEGQFVTNAQKITEDILADLLS